jgi:hypothetical protein
VSLQTSDKTCKLRVSEADFGLILKRIVERNPPPSLVNPRDEGEEGITRLLRPPLVADPDCKIKGAIQTIRRWYGGVALGKAAGGYVPVDGDLSGQKRCFTLLWLRHVPDNVGVPRPQKRVLDRRHPHLPILERDLVDPCDVGVTEVPADVGGAKVRRPLGLLAIGLWHEVERPALGVGRLLLIR